MSKIKKYKIGLVLSGGATYGVAHIGVLKVFKESGIDFDIIGGTSMGAMIGGLYSAGIDPNTMEDMLFNLPRRKITDFSLKGLMGNGFLKGNKILKILEGICHNINIEDCKKKFYCITTDLKSGKKFIFEKGSLALAIRSSISVPGVFKPVYLGDMALVDGGLIDNLPVEEARKRGADFVIAIDVCSFYDPPKKLNTIPRIIMNSADILVGECIRRQKDKGDIYIKIDQPGIEFTKLTKKDIKMAIENGESIAKKFVPKILRKIRSLGKEGSSSK